MTCASIMTAEPVTLRDGDTVAKATQILLDNRFIILPVVDDGGRYKGQFGVFELLRILLPRAATIEGEEFNLAFITDTIDDMRDELAAQAGTSIRDHVRTDLPVLGPGTPIIQTVLQIYRSRSPLPVVEEKTGRLVGVVSYWDAIAAVAGSKR